MSGQFVPLGHVNEVDYTCLYDDHTAESMIDYTIVVSRPSREPFMVDLHVSYLPGANAEGVLREAIEAVLQGEWD